VLLTVYCVVFGGVNSLRSRPALPCRPGPQSARTWNTLKFIWIYFILWDHKACLFYNHNFSHSVLLFLIFNFIILCVYTFQIVTCVNTSTVKSPIVYSDAVSICTSLTNILWGWLSHLPKHTWGLKIPLILVINLVHLLVLTSIHDKMRGTHNTKNVFFNWICDSLSLSDPEIPLLQVITMVSDYLIFT
jgi:hypothetical protein